MRSEFRQTVAQKKINELREYRYLVKNYISLQTFMTIFFLRFYDD